jgi:flotillin
MDDIEIGEVNVLDRGDGSALAAYAAAYPQAVAAVLSSLRESIGIDIPAILAASGGGGGGSGGGGGGAKRPSAPALGSLGVKPPSLSAPSFGTKELS